MIFPRPVIAQTYPATPYLRRLTAANGWQGELVRDRHGRPVAIVTVRVGPVWTDAVAIDGEDSCIAMRHHTHGDIPDRRRGVGRARGRD